MATRQSEWQYQHEQMGLCRSCSMPAADGPYCETHAKANRDNCRNRYRMRHGIPLEMAMLKKGRPRAAQF
jgi:hypothetical protein